MTAPNIVASFKSTGICPLDRSVVRVPGWRRKFIPSLNQRVLSRGLDWHRYLCIAHLKLLTCYEAPACMTPLQPLQHNPTIQVLPAGYNAQEESPLEYSPSESPSPFEWSVDNSFQGSIPLRRATSVSNFLIPPLPARCQLSMENLLALFSLVLKIFT